MVEFWARERRESPGATGPVERREMAAYRWVGGWVGGWEEEEEAVGMRYWTFWVGG